ncbi:MAG: hypothetical protein ACE5ED_12690 [Rhodothalassiaceae bacterium]
MEAYRKSVQWYHDPRARHRSTSFAEVRAFLVRRAAEARDGAVLAPVLPPFPFPLLCGKAGTPEWASLRAADMATWQRLWRAMLDDEAFRGFDHLTAADAAYSSRGGLWLRGETFRIQDGVTVATSLPCGRLRQVLE